MNFKALILSILMFVVMFWSYNPILLVYDGCNTSHLL